MESELRLVYAVNLPVQSAILNHPKCVRINLLDCLYTVAAKWQSNRKCSVCVQCCWLRNNIILVYTATEQISLAVDIIHTLSLHFGLKYCEGLRRKYFNPSDKALFRPTKLQCFPIDTTWNIDVFGRKSDKLILNIEFSLRNYIYNLVFYLVILINEWKYKLYNTTWTRYSNPGHKQRV